MKKMVDLRVDIPSDFLKPEVRCGYEISAEMKKVWAVEIDLFYRFVEVCKKYNLTYFAMGGTLLGAVRHKGFIPWDDDIDLLMPRADYNKLLEVGEKEFQEPYFFSTPETEYKFWRSHVQIRNSETLGVIEVDKHRNNNKGIFIDIFVLDVVPDDIEERAAFIGDAFKYTKWLYRDMDAKYKYKGLKGTLLNLAAKLKVNQQSYVDCFRYYNESISKYQDSDYKTVSHTALKYREKVVWNRADFAEMEVCDFEFFKINIPKGYKNILAKQYGDNYMEIPEVHPSTTHGGLEFDVEHSYREYYEGNKK